MNFFQLYFFTKNRQISKSYLEKQMNIPASELLNILRNIAVPIQPRGMWEFLLNTDHKFISM